MIYINDNEEDYHEDNNSDGHDHIKKIRKN